MISTHDIDRIAGSTAYDSAGEKVGKVDQVYLDDQTGEPSWVTVTTGLFGTSQSFVPLEGASVDGSDVRLAYTKDKVKDAPRIDVDQHLERNQEDELYRYYGLGSATGTTGTAGYADTTTGTTTQTTGTETTGLGTTGLGTTGTTGTGTGTGLGTTGTTDEASVVLNEERLDVGTRSEEAGRARLRKYTTTDTETVSVPVTKEKLVVERTPVAGEGAVTSAPIQDTDQVEEVTLREERAVVGKETVAREEVSIAKEQVTETEQVSAEIRKEHADVDVDGALESDTNRGDLGR
jgi:uncharacterized protein (TIGR02271 family)